MTVERDQLVHGIIRALSDKRVNQDGSGAEDIKRQIAEQISDAVDVYVQAKLSKLKTKLIDPAAYIGASSTGPVTINPSTIGTYRPGD